LTESLKWAHGILALILLAVAGFHWNDLYLGHFWDEAWVYAPAVRHMGIHGPSLLQSALPLDYGRGHPLLFQCLGGWWAVLFGASNTSLHSFALLISLATLILVFLLGKTVVNEWAGLAATAFVAVQPMFLAQSAMVFPEMLMTFGLLLAIYGQVTSRGWAFVMGLSVALYAKESALVFLLAFICWDVYRLLFLRNVDVKVGLKYILPLLVMVSHPMLTYLHFGWFFNPEHTGYIKLDFDQVKYDLRNILRWMMEGQMRSWIVFGLVGAAAFMVKFRHWAFNILLLAIGFSAYKILIWQWPLTPVVFVVVMSMLTLSPLVLFWLFRAREGKLSKLEQVVGITYITTIGFMLFSAMNFFTWRYLLANAVLLWTALILVLWRVPALPNYAKGLLSALVCSVGIYASITERGVSEINLGLYDDLRLQEKMVDWISSTYGQDAYICTNFVTGRYLGNTKSGYVNEGNAITSPIRNSCNPSCEAELMVFTSTAGGCDQFMLDSLLQRSDYRVVYNDSLGKSFAKVLEHL
jgi:hypothetical protein